MLCKNYLGYYLGDECCKIYCLKYGYNQTYILIISECGKYRAVKKKCCNGETWDTSGILGTHGSKTVLEEGRGSSLLPPVHL